MGTNTKFGINTIFHHITDKTLSNTPHETTNIISHLFEHCTQEFL